MFIIYWGFYFYFCFIFFWNTLQKFGVHSFGVVRSLESGSIRVWIWIWIWIPSFEHFPTYYTSSSSSSIVFTALYTSVVIELNLFF